MSEIKGRRQSVRKQTATKSQWTKQKPKAMEQSKGEPETTVAKNLMREFNEALVQQRSEQKASQLVGESSVELSSNQDQASQMSVLQESSIVESQASQYRLDAQQQSLSFQLPKSYILAMRGLQQAVETRDKEVRKLKKMLREQASQYQDCSQLKEEEARAREAAEIRLSEMALESKFLKDMINDLKAQALEQLKLKIDVETQLKQTQEKSRSYCAEIEKLKNEAEVAAREKTSLKEQLQQVTRYLKERKEEYDSTMRKRHEDYGINFAEVSSLKSELSKLREQHEKDIGEISFLKSEIRSMGESIAFEQQCFKEQLLLAEKTHLDKLELDLTANRQILKDLTFNQTWQQQQLASHSRRNNYEDQEATATFANKKEAPRNEEPHLQEAGRPRNDHAASTEYRQSLEKRHTTSERTPKVERSASRLRQTNDSEHPQRRELVGQMRELMRHEKELVSLNYQMEVLEKSMLGEGSGSRREETQKTYARLRKSIERKELEVRELKAFLDTPLKGRK